MLSWHIRVSFLTCHDLQRGNSLSQNVLAFHILYVLLLKLCKYSFQIDRGIFTRETAVFTNKNNTEKLFFNIVSKVTAVIKFYETNVCVIIAPNIDPIVPRNDMAPEVPFGTLANLIT